MLLSSNRLFLLLKPSQRIPIEETKQEAKEVKKETSIPQSNTKSHIASPSARKIITENNLEISDITGTGKDGRVTKEDAVNSKKLI